MLARLARIILALSTFPLIGAYGLRWAGGFVAQVIGTTGVDSRALALLDLAGGILGLILGALLAVQLIGCCLQPESLPVRPAGDTILVLLGLLIVADVALMKFLGAADWLRWLPAANLLAWSGAAAATASLHRMRQHNRFEHPYAEPPTDPPSVYPYGT